MKQVSQEKCPSVALVTGAGRRIGAVIAEHLHAAGFNILIHCFRSFKEADLLAQGFNEKRPGSAWVLKQDLSEVRAAEKLISAAIDAAGRLDVLVNNASVFTPTDCLLASEAASKAWETLFLINTKLPFLLSLASRPFLEQNSGVIVNITDLHATRALKDYAIYCQSKAALWMQTQALAKELAPKIRVNAVAPGAMLWPEQENCLAESKKEKIIASTPLKCHGDPRYIAMAVLALIENTFITGETLHVDGGRCIS